jgi:hypothetical protein
MSLDTIKNILKDLSKIEYALRIENVDSKINDVLSLAIIDIYRCVFFSSGNQQGITTDTLFDVYAAISLCCKTQDTQFQDIIDDIILQMKQSIEKKV